MEWIKLKEIRPTVGIRVLVIPTGENVVISHIEDDGENGFLWLDDDGNYFALDTVKYWMPLPKEPKK